MEPHNAELRRLELQTLIDIYGDELRAFAEDCFEIDIIVSEDLLLPAANLSVLVPSNYISHGAQFTFRCEWMDRAMIEKVAKVLGHEFSPAGDEAQEANYIYRAIEWIRSSMLEHLGLDAEALARIASGSSAQSSSSSTSTVPVPQIHHGEPILDRKSKFVAHLAFVRSKAEVKAVLDELYKNKRIAQATHNVAVYRIEDPTTGHLDEHRDDDGEGGAGEPVLHLMQSLECINCLIVISRWFGGIELGPDRFRRALSPSDSPTWQHLTRVPLDINNAAKNLILQLRADEQKQKEEESASKKHQRLRPVPDVMSWIRWHPSSNPEDFVVGYDDRFLGVQEVPFSAWDGELSKDVPLHRIVYFKRNGKIVWDKRDRTDLIFVEESAPDSSSSTSSNPPSDT